MHYRHAYHAGNFADVFKHVLLCGLLDALSRKDAAWCYLDTHAGAGGYDLGGIGAGATGEWRDGIARLAAVGADAPPLVAAYLAQVRAYGGATPGAYPGSPLLAAALARAQDRLLLCEQLPEIAEALRETLGKRAAIHVRDGYEAAALLPPAEKRGLVLIDPPFERSDEIEALAGFLAAAVARFSGGVYAAWYPLKNPHVASRFRRRVARETARPVLDLRLDVGGAPESANERRATRIVSRGAPSRAGAHRAGVASVAVADKRRMHACGLLIVNPPFGFEAQARDALAFLTPLLAQGADAAWQAETVSS